MHNLQECQKYKIVETEKPSSSLGLPQQVMMLRDAADQIAQMAEILAKEELPPQSAPVSEADYEAIASRHYSFRRRRAKILGSNIACGPAWDILLDLFINHYRNRKVAVSDATIAASCPHATALRWIEVLMSVGIVRKEPDPNDARRSFVVLTAHGLEKMHTSLGDNGIQTS